MSALEESLRRALQNGNADDPQYRLSIYQASERAMEKMLADKAAPAAEATRRRHALAEAIAHIEADYGTPDADGHPGQDASWHDDPAYAAQAGVPATAQEGEDAAPMRDGAAMRHARGPFASPAFIGIVAALFLVILLYVLSTVFQGGDTEPGQSGDTAGTVGATSDLSWINVFSGGNIDVLATPQGGRVEAISLDGREAVRMQSPDGQGGEVLLNVGPGLVGELAGSTVRVELTAGSPDSTSREFSVRCLFGQASVCDRQRFVTSMQEEAFVFDVAVPSDAATPASLAIAPGVGGQGGDIDLFAVRVRVLG